MARIESEMITSPTGERVGVTYCPAKSGSSYRTSEYDVMLDIVGLGQVFKQPFTRERRSPGDRYVLRRWRTPAWTWQLHGEHSPSHIEAYSRRDAAERLLREYIAKQNRNPS